MTPERVFTLNDLFPIQEVTNVVAQVNKRERGTLKKSEILVNEGPNINDGDIIIPEEDSLANVLNYDMWFRGQLPDGTTVRVMKRTCYHENVDLSKVPKHELTDEVVRLMGTRNYPKVGDALAVYWFSEGLIPTAFRGNREPFVDALCTKHTNLRSLIPYRGRFIARSPGDNTDLKTYSLLIGLSNQLWSRYEQKIGNSESLSLSESERRAILGEADQETLDFKTLLEKTDEEIIVYASQYTVRDQEILDRFQGHQASMRDNYHECLTLLASLNIRKLALESLVKIGGLPVNEQSYVELINSFYTSFLNELDGMASRTEEPITRSDISFLINQAYTSTIAQVTEKAPVEWGGYGGGERRNLR